jgi:hypothetical protein
MTETVELTRAECLQLLGKEAVSRVVSTSEAMPAAEPVDYILDSGEVIFHVPRDGPLAEATRHAVVGFQADDIDPTTHISCSVLGVGQTYEVTNPSRYATLATRTPAWGPDSTTRTIALPLQRLTGHQIRRAVTVRG